MNYQKPEITAVASAVAEIQTVEHLKGAYMHPDSIQPGGENTDGAYEADE